MTHSTVQGQEHMNTQGLRGRFPYLPVRGLQLLREVFNEEGQSD